MLLCCELSWIWQVLNFRFSDSCVSSEVFPQVMDMCVGSIQEGVTVSILTFLAPKTSQTTILPSYVQEIAILQVKKYKQLPPF